jgi:hypothetical protein
LTFFGEDGLEGDLPPGIDECVECKLVALGEDSDECWGCDAVIHPTCRKDHPTRTPYYCPGCRLELRNLRDLTLDVDLLKYICDGIPPASADKLEIV